MLAKAKVPRTLLPAQYFLAEDMDKVVDRVAGVMISKGYPVTPNALAPPGTPPGLVVRIRPGYRAVAVKVSEEQQAGGWLVPGAHVDVSAVFQVRKQSPGGGAAKTTTVTQVILEDIEVAAVGQSLGGTSQEPGANIVKSVTLLVKAEDVPRLHYAQTKGKVTFAVRGHRDTPSGQLASLDEDDMWGSKRAGQGESPSASQDPGMGPLLGLIGKAFAKADGPAVSSDAPEVPGAALTPFTVEVINGEDQAEKVYENQNSRVELKPSAFGQRRSSLGGSRQAGDRSSFLREPSRSRSRTTAEDSGEELTVEGE
jgi:Flp pilus assembly protein CpaB